MKGFSKLASKDAATVAKSRKKVRSGPSRRIRSIAAVLAIAAGTGHVMQNGSAIAAILGIQGGAGVAPLATPASANAASAAAPTQPDAMHLAQLAPPELDQPPLAPVADSRPVALPATPMPILSPTPVSARLGPLPGGSTPAPKATALTACTPELTARPAAAAMVALSVSAPCAPDAVVTIRHAGIGFSLKTDAEGAAAAEVPALAQTATFRASLPDGAASETSIRMPTLAGYDRVAVSWEGTQGLELHAFEFGAGYADPGHVWSGNPRDASWAIRATGGFLTRLGDDSTRTAEIYTFPAGRSPTAGSIRLTLEAQVTDATCGGRIAGHTVQSIAGAEADGVDVTVAMPGCDAKGDYLVLNNLFGALKIAAN